MELLITKGGNADVTNQIILNNYQISIDQLRVTEKFDDILILFACVTYVIGYTNRRTLYNPAF